MSIFSKIKDVLNNGDEIDDFSDEIEIDETLEEEQSTHEERKNETVSFGYNKTREVDSRMTQSTNTANNNVGSKLSVVLFKPVDFGEVTVIADQLNKKNTVVLNLESANKDNSQRIIDFLGGVAYANDGRFNKVANSTYIITPYNVDMHGEEIGDFDVNSLF